MHGEVVQVEVRHVALQADDRRWIIRELRLRAQDPAFLRDLLGGLREQRFEAEEIAIACVKAGNAVGERVAGQPNECARRLRTCMLGEPPWRQCEDLRVFLDEAVGVLRHGDTEQHAATLVDERCIERIGSEWFLQQSVEVVDQRVAHIRVLGAGEKRCPVARHPQLDEGPVELSLLTEHEVHLERPVEIVRPILALRELLLEAKEHSGEQQAIELASIDGNRLRAELVALIESELADERRGIVAMGIAARQLASGVEQRQNGTQVALADALELEVLGACVKGGGLLLDLLDRRGVVEISGDPTGRHQKNRRGGSGENAVVDVPGAFFHFGVGAHQAGLAENYVADEACQEIAAAGAAEGRDLLTRYAEARGDRSHQPIDRRAELRPAGEIDAAEPGRLLEAGRREDFPKEAVGELLDARDLLRKSEDQRAALKVGLLLQPLAEALIETADQSVELGGILVDRSPPLPPL